MLNKNKHNEEIPRKDEWSKNSRSISIPAVWVRTRKSKSGTPGAGNSPDILAWVLREFLNDATTSWVLVMGSSWRLFVWTGSKSYNSYGGQVYTRGKLCLGSSQRLRRERGNSSTTNESITVNSFVVLGPRVQCSLLGYLPTLLANPLSTAFATFFFHTIYVENLWPPPSRGTSPGASSSYDRCR